MNTDRIASRIATDLALHAGYTPRAILLDHYLFMGRRSKTASEKSSYKDASKHIRAFGLSFFREVSKELGVGIGALVDFFKDSQVVRFFQKIGWSFKKLLDYLKTGYETLKKLQTEFLKFAKETGIGHWTMRNLDAPMLAKIDEWMKGHSQLRHITGFALAGMFLYMWFITPYTGNLGFDFDMSEVFDALSGNYSLVDLFSGASGATWLLLFLTGTFVGISFPWPGALSVHFVVSAIWTLSKKLNKRLKQMREKPEDDESILDLVPSG